MYGGADNAADYARGQERQRQINVRRGMGEIDTNFKQFDEPFYDARRQAYLDYATPSFQDQYAGTRNSLAYQMARRGLLQSGAAVTAGKSLAKYAGQKSREIADAAQAEENKLRGDVSNQRSTLVNQVLASGDPTAASTGALTAAAALRTPSAFTPLGNFFDDWTRMWQANQVARAYNPQVQPMFSFGGGTSSSRIVG